MSPKENTEKPKLSGIEKFFLLNSKVSESLKKLACKIINLHGLCNTLEKSDNTI